jgi:2-oxoglutarate ferredoxin oxidoreductase subunit gamma
MTTSLIFAGYGGQGVILAGKLLCIASMKMGLHVSHIPSYGVEMRGGTANCSVVIANHEIPSPLVFHPDVVCVFNEPSLAKFGPQVREGGIILYNASLIKTAPVFPGVSAVPVNANDLAERTTGSAKTANMVMVGALAALKPELVTLDVLSKALEDAISSRNKAKNVKNIDALKAGFDAVAALVIR